MPDPRFAELYRLVLDALAKAKPKSVREDIEAAHMYDRPQGFISRETSGLVRQYRNNVSPNPQHLIDAARAYAKEESNVPHV
jgi:hypothetical protein